MKMISALLLLSLFCLHNSFTLSLSHSPSNETDYLSLMDFRSMITNSDTVLGKNWTSNTSFCNWIGVTCSSQRQRVTALILPHMSLEGEISPSIGNLTFLTTLDLSKNQLTGSIPRSIFNLRSMRLLLLANNSLSGSLFLNGENSSSISELEILELGFNQLTGEIPSSLCHFGQLKSLGLSLNNLTGKIPENIGCLSKLERLLMGGNRISGNIPSSLGNISTLQILNYRQNSIGGPIPPELGKLTNLQMLFLSVNNLTGEIPPGIFNLSSLRVMAITTNNLSGPIPSTADLHHPNLEEIYLANNKLEGEIPLSITNASKLQVLELSYNMFVGPVPSNFGNLKELRLLNLQYNQLTNEPRNEFVGFFDSLVECRMLQNLVVGNNPLGGSLPGSIQNLSTSILRFYMDNSQISGHIPAGIGNLSSMIALNLIENSLTGTIPVELGNLNNLQRMHLYGNKLNGELPNELCNLLNLGVMSISMNDLSGPIPSCIGKLTRIQRLYLSKNRLTSTLPLGFWRLEELLNLDLSGNLIQGELHSDIRKLKGIVTIDLSDNQFAGSIPNSLGELTELSYLNISSNLLNGSIPTSFGNLLSLEDLDLSQNHLSGSIPASLEMLSYLRDVNFSYNQLEGQIPPDGISLNSSRENFEGNKGLCGMPSLGFPLCHTHNASQWSPGSRNFMLSIIIPVITLVTLLVIMLSIWIMRRRKGVRHEDVELVDNNEQRKISYHQILRGTDGFNEANLLGVGSSGSVFKAILADGELVAVKVLNLDGNEGKKRFDAECDVLKQIRHRNLVRIITTCSNDSLKAIILPYMPNGNLETWLHKPGHVLNLQQRIEVMLDVAKAVEYLHHGNDFPVVHCDLKPSNVLLDIDMVAHVSDFGISKIVDRETRSVLTRTLGTIGYIAPEYGSEGIVSVAGDVYSYGIMLMEVLMRRRPTDELFTSNLSLRQWVEDAHPNSLNKVVDSNLFHDQENGFVRHHVHIQSMIELSLHCSSETPEERINMKDVVIKLTKIKRELLK